MKKLRRLRATTSLSISSSRVFCLTLAGFAAGCSQFGSFSDEPFTLGIDLESPPYEIDITEPVQAAEESLCDDGQSETCLITQALDRADDGQVQNPPRVPEQFPAQIDVEDENGNPVPDVSQCDPAAGQDCPQLSVNVEDWIAESGLTQSIRMQTVLPVDLTEEAGLAGNGVPSGVEIVDLGVNWAENTLAVSAPDLDLYLSLQELTGDAAELIDSGTVEKIGTLEGQQANTSGVTNIRFLDDDAERKFSDALLGLTFTLVTSLPEDAELALAEGDTPGTLLKPQGTTNLSLVGRLQYNFGTPSEIF